MGNMPTTVPQSSVVKYDPVAAPVAKLTRRTATSLSALADTAVGGRLTSANSSHTCRSGAATAGVGGTRPNTVTAVPNNAQRARHAASSDALSSATTGLAACREQ